MKTIDQFLVAGHKRRVAIHESGHAAMAFLAGVKIHKLCLYGGWGEGFGGYCQTSNTKATASIPEIMAILLGGVSAEGALGIDTKQGGIADRADIKKLLKGIMPLSDHNIAELATKLQTAVETWVMGRRSLWAAIEQVADVLELVGDLDGAAVEAHFKDALGSELPRMRKATKELLEKTLYEAVAGKPAKPVTHNFDLQHGETRVLRDSTGGILAKFTHQGTTLRIEKPNGQIQNVDIQPRKGFSK
jgi:hypothetical protein